MRRLLELAGVRKILFQSLLFVLGSLILGAQFDGNADTSALAKKSSSENQLALISLSEAETLALNRKAIFIDSRPASDYVKGHIPRALSIPFDDVDNSVAKHMELFLSNEKCVVYCGGERCRLSELLAQRLLLLGFGDVSVFPGGWDEWKGAGLAVEE